MNQLEQPIEQVQIMAYQKNLIWISAIIIRSRECIFFLVLSAGAYMLLCRKTGYYFGNRKSKQKSTKEEEDKKVDPSLNLQKNRWQVWDRKILKSHVCMCFLIKKKVFLSTNRIILARLLFICYKNKTS